jgi:hypothetical protein
MLLQKNDASKEHAQNQGFLATTAQSIVPAVSAICSLCDAARRNLGNAADDSIFYCLNSGHRDSWWRRELARACFMRPDHLFSAESIYKLL